MSSIKKVLVLTSSFGNGHVQVAKAIEESIRLRFAHVEIVELDIMHMLHPKMMPISKYVYMKSLKKLPKVYEYMYQKTKVRTTFSEKMNAMFLTGEKRLLTFVQQHDPVAIVSTYPFAAGLVSKMKEKNNMELPSITVITDYAAHSYWIYKNTDHYFVASNEVRRELLAEGVQLTKIAVTGIPILPKFFDQSTTQKLDEMNKRLQNKFTLLIMGGGDGFFSKPHVLKSLMNDSLPSIHIIFVCGTNKKLKENLLREFDQDVEKITIVGFCDNIHELMAISDLLITKSGGVTTTEAIAMQLPFLIFNPLPGQEQENAKFFQDQGISIVALTEQDLLEKVKLFLTNQETIPSIKSKMNGLFSKQNFVQLIQSIEDQLHLQDIDFVEVGA